MDKLLIVNVFVYVWSRTKKIHKINCRQIKVSKLLPWPVYLIY